MLFYEQIKIIILIIISLLKQILKYYYYFIALKFKQLALDLRCFPYSRRPGLDALRRNRIDLNKSNRCLSKMIEWWVNCILLLSYFLVKNWPKI